ncbi:MAG: ABC transporter permease [Coriobacteriia bacterium]|nr:ABC transporter permease [Coriobacteriia bacterium]
MITRLIAAELAGLRRSWVVWVATLLTVGGAIVARSIAWVTHAIGSTELSALPFVRPDIAWSDTAVPLALLAYLIVTSYVFGRDFEDGTIDLILTAPVRRGAIVVARTLVVGIALFLLCLMGWAADAATYGLLATTPLDPGPATGLGAAFGSGMAAFGTLSLVSWAAVRFRGVLPALGLGIAIQAAALALGGLEAARSLPWLLPSAIASGGDASLLAVSLTGLLFAGGFAATVHSLDRVDLSE